MTPASGRTADNASFGEMHDALRTALADEAVNLAVSLTEAVLADGLGFKGPFEEFGRIAEPLLLDALGAARRDGAQIANEAAAPILAQLRSDLAAARKESADYTAVVEQALRDKDEQNASLRSQLQEAQKALKPFAACVFNDNGDVTVTTSYLTSRDWLSAKLALLNQEESR